MSAQGIAEQIGPKSQSNVTAARNRRPFDSTYCAKSGKGRFRVDEDWKNVVGACEFAWR
jgi:hypothetical protein